MKPLALLLCLFFFQYSHAQTSSDSKPVGQRLTVASFTVMLFKDSVAHPEVKDVLAVLTEKLSALSKIVPARQFAKLQQVPIWIEYKLKPDGAVWYHKSKEWVVANGWWPMATQPK